MDFEKGFREFRRFKGFKGWWYRPAGDEYKVSVTGFTFVSQAVHDGEPGPLPQERGRKKQGSKALFSLYIYYYFLP